MIRAILDFFEFRWRFAQCRLQVLEVDIGFDTAIEHGNFHLSATFCVLGTGLDFAIEREAGLPWQTCFIVAFLTVPFKFNATFGYWPEPEPSFIEDLINTLTAEEARIRNEAATPRNPIVIACGDEPEDFGDDEAVFDWLVEAER